MAQQLKGKIVSNKMTKTVVVEVSRLKKHPRYGKFIKVTDNYKAHTEALIPIGSTVIIKSVRPISKDKRWKIVSIERRPAVDVVPPTEILEDNADKE